MKAKGIIAVLVVAGLLVFVAISVFGGSKDKAASIRTAPRGEEGEVHAGGEHPVRSPLDTKQEGVPCQMNYQGYLVDSSDSSAITGTREMIFKIYDAETGGSVLWSETHGSVEVGNGLFNVLLGTPDTLFTGGQDLWLETTVGGETLSPRKKLVSVGYAFHSFLADSAKPKDVPFRIKHKGDPNTFIEFNDDQIDFFAGGVRMITAIEGAAPDRVIINDGGANVDFRVEAVGVPNALFVRGSDGKVSVNGPAHHPGGYALCVNNSVALIRDAIGNAAGVAYWTATGEDWYTGTLPNKLYYTIRHDADDKLVVTQDGKVGVGTTDPKSNLHVTGLPEYANNAAAIAGGLTAGAFYRNGDDLKVVH